VVDRICAARLDLKRQCSFEERHGFRKELKYFLIQTQGVFSSKRKLAAIAGTFRRVAQADDPAKFH
jgi:hypothetical protein